MQTHRTITIINPAPVGYITLIAPVSGYTSDVAETDDSPNITAWQTAVREGVAACPRIIPFGTEIEIDKQIYRCEDRTNQRFDGYFDLWFRTKQEAYAWGKQIKTIKIYEIRSIK